MMTTKRARNRKHEPPSIWMIAAVVKALQKTLKTLPSPSADPWRRGARDALQWVLGHSRGFDLVQKRARRELKRQERDQ